MSQTCGDSLSASTPVARSEATSPSSDRQVLDIVCTPLRARNCWSSSVSTGRPSGSLPHTNWQLSLVRPLIRAWAQRAEMASGTRPKAKTSNSMPGVPRTMVWIEDAGSSGGRQMEVAPLLASTLAVAAL